MVHKPYCGSFGTSGCRVISYCYHVMQGTQDLRTCRSFLLKTRKPVPGPPKYPDIGTCTLQSGIKATTMDTLEVKAEGIRLRFRRSSSRSQGCSRASSAVILLGSEARNRPFPSGLIDPWAHIRSGDSKRIWYVTPSLWLTDVFWCMVQYMSIWAAVMFRVSPKDMNFI